MKDTIKELRTKRLKAVTDARAILDASTDPTLSAEDEARYSALMKESDDLKAAIERHEKLEAEERQLAQPAGEPPTRGNPTPAGDDKKAKRTVETVDYRKAFASYLRTGTVGNELRALQMDSDTAGGYLVAPQE